MTLIRQILCFKMVLGFVVLDR